MPKRKSKTTAILLTVLFGPLGLLYLSIGQALLGILMMFFAFALAGSMGTLWPFGIMYLLIVAVAVSMTNAHNAEIDKREQLDETRHQELLRATREAAVR